MSDPKPLRFARVDQTEGTPEWVEAGQKSGTDVKPLVLPNVAVDAIDRAPDTGDVDEAIQSVEELAGAAANINSGQRSQDAKAPTAPPPPTPPPPAVDPELERRLEEAVTAFTQAAAELAVARKEVLANAESELLELATQVAQAIIEQEVATQPELHVALVQAALSAVDDGTEAELRVGPTALAAIKDRMGAEAFEYNGIEVKVRVEPGLTELGCLVDTARRRIDGRVAQRLLAVRRAFEDERRRKEVAS